MTDIVGKGKIVIVFKCTKCSHEFKAPDEYAGKKVRCKNCNNVNAVPSSQPAAQEKPVIRSCNDSVAAYNNLFKELLQQEKTAPTIELEAHK